MARARKLETFADFERALKNGYGKGEAKDYKPWIRVQDVSSHGNSAKIQGMKSGREHHLLSEQESSFFYLAEYCDSIVDIREQFPLLPLDLSVKIAKNLDIKHPQHPISKAYNVMTIDFMLTRTDGQNTWHEAVSVKPLDAFLQSNKKRQRMTEKLEIERIWCELLGIPFHIFSITDENRIQSQNIQWLTSSSRRGECFDDDNLLHQAIQKISKGTYLLSELCLDLEVEFFLNSEQSIRLVKALITKKWINVDLSLPIAESGMIKITKTAEIKDEKYAS